MALLKAKKYTEEQIIAVLPEVEAGARVVDPCRKHEMSDVAVGV
jgi:putative transposase